jgi:hypothetical protein
VKQSELGEYEENVREKHNIQYTRQKHQLPLKPSHMDGKHQFPTQEGSKKSTRFLNAKDHTLPEVENPRFYHMNLDKPQGKHRPLKQQGKSRRI